MSPQDLISAMNAENNRNECIALSRQADAAAAGLSPLEAQRLSRARDAMVLRLVWNS